MEYRKTVSLACVTGFLLLLTASDILCLVNNVMDDSRNRERLTSTRINFTISEEKRLAQYLLWKYSVAGRRGRPVVNTSQSTTVEFGLGLIQMALDERSKTLITSMWSRLKWHDVYLTWDPNDFGNVTTVRLESDEVWLPDIMLYNTAEPENGARDALVVVTYDGTVQWVPHQIFRSSCSIDVTNFPFDEQQCHMWFGSWTHTLPDIDLKLSFDGGIDLTTFQSDYKDSCEWDIIESVAERKLLPPDDPKPIAVISFMLLLRRKRVFSSYILTLPCVILAVLTLVVFWLPADRPDRTSLAMNLLTSFLLLLLILIEAAPPTASSVPLLGVYYCFNMVVITLSIFLSTLVVNISRAGQKGRPPPKWLRVLVLRILAKLVCIYPEGCRQRFTEISCYCCGGGHKDEGRKDPNMADEDGNDLNSHLDSNHFVPEAERLVSRNADLVNDWSRNWRAMADLENSSQYSSVQASLQDIHRSLRYLVQLVSAKDKRGAYSRRLCTEWRDIATVLDRLFFCLYVAVVISSMVTLSPRP